MAVRIRIQALSAPAHLSLLSGHSNARTATGSNDPSIGTPTWTVLLACGGKEASFSLTNPFETLRTSRKFSSIDPEQLLLWYLEKHNVEPFEVSKAGLAADLVSSYGQNLSKQIMANGIVPRDGQIEIEISGSCSAVGGGPIVPSGANLHELHWEVLEALDVWPKDCAFTSASVYRTVSCAGSDDVSEIRGSPTQTSSRFNILYIVSRPELSRDVDHQLVSRRLADTIDRVSKKALSLKISLKILRPPTWAALEDHLLFHCAMGHYDLVHFDMHGKVLDPYTDKSRAVLNFCKPSIRNPLQMRKDPRSGENIGKLLAQAGVKNAILNACETAKVQHGNLNSNLAEVLLRSGLHCVLAMSFKVVEEAVEIFMGTFYSSLLSDGLSFHHAARVARLALLCTRARRAPYMQTIHLSDYIIPVLYLDRTPPVKETPESLAKISSLGTINMWSSPRYPSQIARLSALRKFLGRDTDILRLEVLLSTYKTVLVHGMGGSGKTKLLEYCCNWWTSTGWIEGFAYLDVEAFTRTKGSMEDFLNSICEQLGVGVECQKEPDLVSLLQNRSYALVLDSLESVPGLSTRSRSSPLSAIAGRLKAFLKAASNGATMVILCSRRDHTPLAELVDYQCFLLSGLPVVASIELADQITFGGNSTAEVKRNGDDIELLSRIVILLEGFPAAIKLVFPALRDGRNTLEGLLTSLLYGSFEVDQVDLRECRFYETIRHTIRDIEQNQTAGTRISAGHFSPFWTIMPRDLEYYFWFYLLSLNNRSSEEPLHECWLEDRFSAIVRDALSAHSIDVKYRSICQKLENAQVLRPAFVVISDSSKLPCYHVHPIFTMVARMELTESKQWEHMKFSYVRQFLVWVKSASKGIMSDMVSVEWDGITQHIDLLTNPRVIALAYSLDGGNLQDEIDYHGTSIFHTLCECILKSLLSGDRQAALFIPLVKQHLLRLHMLLLFRTGGIPNSDDLAPLLVMTHRLFRIDKDYYAVSRHISAAFSVIESWKTANLGTSLPLGAEESWFELRAAEAHITIRTQTHHMAKKLFERNLGDDPCTRDKRSLSFIRAVQFENFTHWLNCLTTVMLEDKTMDQNRLDEVVRKTTEMVRQFEPGDISQHLRRFLQTNRDDEVNSMTMGEIYAPALEREKVAVSKFGKMAKQMLNEPVIKSFEYFFEAQMPGLKCSGTSNTPTLEDLMRAFVDASKHDPESESLLRTIEWGSRQTAGDVSGANSVIASSLAHESPASNTPMGWRHLAALHNNCFESAVIHSNEPNYRKGLFHLDELWKLHRGVDVPASSLFQQHMDYATCYDGLQMTVETGRAVLKAVELIPKLLAERCPDETSIDRGPIYVGCYMKISCLKTLDVFSEPRALVSAWDKVKGSSRQERALLRRVVNEAKRISRHTGTITGYLGLDGHGGMGGSKEFAEGANRGKRIAMEDGANPSDEQDVSRLLHRLGIDPRWIER